jgi:hypothetical protein
LNLTRIMHSTFFFFCVKEKKKRNYIKISFHVVDGNYVRGE